MQKELKQLAENPSSRTAIRAALSALLKAEQQDVAHVMLVVALLNIAAALDELRPELVEVETSSPTPP